MWLLPAAVELLVSQESEHRDDGDDCHDAEDCSCAAELARGVEQECFRVVQDGVGYRGVGLCGLERAQDDGDDC